MNSDPLLDSTPDSGFATLRQRSAALNRHYEQMDETFHELPAAVREDLQHRHDRLTTMLKALNRDIDELLLDHGADREKVAALESVIETELDRFEHEVESLSLGAPSTVTAILNKLVDTMERIGDRFRK